MLSGLRLSFRIARREALRYKGRSALSIALLGIPLLGVSLGASAWDTMELSPVEATEQKLGETDAYLRFDWEGIPVVQHTWDTEWGWTEVPGEPETMPETVPVSEDQILAALPEGSTIAPYTATGFDGSLRVETPDGVGGIQTAGYDLSDPMYEAAGLEYLEGGAPESGQIVLSQAAADYTGAGVGDAVTLADGTAEYTVSGIVELPWDLKTPFAIGDFFEVAAAGWLVDTPEEFTYDDALALNELGMYVWSTPLAADPPTAPPDDNWDGGDNGYTAMVVGLIATVVVVEIVLLAGPAFAISARRRSREFAIMSAAGAAPRHLRNTVLAGGLLFGIVAAVIAVVVGLLAVWAAMPLMEGVAGHRSAGLRIWPVMQGTMVAFAIVTGLLSALAAAVSASRVNVVAALAGRTPKRRLKKRWPIIGLVVIGIGVAAGFAGVVLWSMPLMAAAIVALQLGLVMCTPLLVALVAKLGRWLPLAPRMALREAGRNRGSTAPAIAAVMSVVAAGIAISLTVAADNVRWQQYRAHTLPQGALTVHLSSEGEFDESGQTAPPDFDAEFAQVERILSEHLDGLEAHRIADYMPQEEDCGPYLAESAPGAEESVPEGCLIMYRAERPEENQCPFMEADTETEAALEAALEEARNDPRCDETTATMGFNDSTPGSDDPAVVAAYTELEGDELDEAVSFLEDGGVLTSDRWKVNEDGNVEFTLSYYDSEAVDGEREEVVEVPAMTVDKGLLGYNQVFLGPAAAEHLGLADHPWSAQYLLETSTEVTDTLQQQLAGEFERAPLDDLWVSFEVTDYTDETMFYFVLAVALLCGIVALGATAVSTGLIIAESKADMTTLGAVGAEPRVRKRFAMWQTLVIAWLGAGLGTAAGLLGYVLIREALNRGLKNQYPFEALYGWELPWANFGISLLAVPLIAAVGALLFTKARLPSERRLT
ncbi:ABC transporter permease [Glycomyces arizonensis]|uniref:ABC transporter permease n=1 Tax=Glycomyces arizonensis TaxID=256035 RepID=UPI00047CFD1D|nr:ABC transporter permease [Glycomyces arizonensis]